MNKTLVTGAGGLVGYALKRLSPDGFIYITRDDVDLTNFEKTKAIFASIKPQRVIHLAAVVGGIGSNMIHSGEYFRNNIMINTNVLECARLNGVSKLISFMSTCVFPNNCNYPLNERDLHSGPPHSSNFGYAYAKRMLEVQSNAYRKEWNCDYVVAIPANIYGENDNWSFENGHVIPSLIHKCYVAKKTNQDLYVWGSGAPLREFIYSEDIARLALWCIDSYSEDSPIILSSGEEISIKDIVNLIADELSFEGNIVFDGSKPDGQIRKPSDTSKFRKYYSDFKFTSIQEGLKRTIQWFIKHYPMVRM